MSFSSLLTVCLVMPFVNILSISVELWEVILIGLVILGRRPILYSVLISCSVLICF